MMEQFTHHVGSVTWMHLRDPFLDVSNLLHLIRSREEFQEKSRAPRGKKRSAPSSAPANRKRLRRDPSVISLSEEPETIELDDEQASISVYHHQFVLQFRNVGHNTQAESEDEDSDIVLQDPTHRLKQWLRQSNGKSENYEFSDVLFKPDGSRLVAYVHFDGSDRTLLHLPAIDSEFNIEDHDIRNPNFRNPLIACTKLEGAARAKMFGKLRVIPLPLDQAPGQGLFPLELHLDLNVSLLRPAIFEPIVHNSKIQSAEIDEAQRRFLTFVFPSKDPLPDSFRGDVDISLLYSILRPAPFLLSKSLERFVQPAALVPTLLPFQRRSVAWMLGRENKTLSDSGDLIARENGNDLPLFWQRVNVAEQELYFNRVTGALSSDAPEEKNPPLGGILAEEPGLGKTLECIALILLSPAIGRNPTIMSWDPSARINVREVQTTLIVTPAALAQQWADELTLHAPGLRVFIYDGWAKVPVPISEEAVARVRAQRTKSKAKTKARAARAALARTPSVEQRPRKGKKKAPAKGKRKPRAPVKPVDLVETDEEEEEEIVDWCTFINTFDVCITTYNVLQHDLGVARPPPDRPRRACVDYANLGRSRSPLVMCEWYRVIMDEVQMVGGGKTEEMVSLIPRLSSFAVSGTPARAQVADLVHVMKFLCVDDVVDHPKVWSRLLKPGYVNEFVSLFQRYTVRTMKASVKDELTIPKQTRFLIPIEMGRVERHVYDQNFEAALLELGLDARGVAANEDWEVDTAALRTWLRKLRGICTHPQVGQLQHHADKLHKPGVLKSIAEVLEGMSDQNWRNFMEDRRNKIQATTLQVQLVQHDDKNRNRYKVALQLVLAAEKEAKAVIADVQEAMSTHRAEGKALKVQVAESQGQTQETTNDETMEIDDPEVSNDKGKGKAREATPAESESAGSEDTDIPRNPAGEEYGIKKRALQQRLRECQISLHRIYFLQGDVYHVLGNSYTGLEDEAYANAGELRRVLLRSTEEAAKRAMGQLAHDASTKGITKKELMIKVPYCSKGGIKSWELMEEANEIIDELLNKQSALLWGWRTHLVGLLTQSLTSADTADGQEYNRSLDTQGEAEAYLQAYAALLADRREAMTAERTLLAAHAVKETKARKTKAAAKATAAALLDEGESLMVDDIDLQPEHQVLQKELSDERKEILEDFDSSRAIRSVMVDLNNIAAKIAKEDDPERVIAKEGASDLRRLMAEQARLMDKLQADLALFRKAFNDRISYFRQLQELSDNVTEATWEGPVVEAIARVENERSELDVKINTGRARQRYLEHLAKSQEEGTMDEDDECCILCKCEFTRGYITQCAHVFCEGCMKAWLVRKEGKACPVCRVPINPDQLQRFAVADGKTQDPPSILRNNEAAPKSRRHIEYNIVDPDLFESIQMMESHGSYGTKIQTLVRHLLYLQVSDPNSKSIVFSAWADSLHIIEYALKLNGITSLRVDKNSGKQNAAKKFRVDPTISVLLLHGERENAGLNVTCASRVFLVESVVNHAFEVQAIARIDRMGQTRPTEVYCYYAEETVERHILDLAARQGKSLYTKENAAGTLNPNRLDLNSDKKVVDSPTKQKNAQKGDFVFKMEDMLAIFFPHLFEDIEYLIPAEELGLETSGSQPSQVPDPPAPGPSRTRRQTRSENAVAGPSRLR